MADDPLPVSSLLRWSEALAGIARTGLGFTTSLFERERYEEILHVAADMRAELECQLATGDPGSSSTAESFVAEWMRSLGEGVAGYVTPRVAVGAVVGDEEGRILLVQRADSGAWLYPTGWADVGYSPAEVAAKEVLEEAGLEVDPLRLIMVLDGMRLGFTRIPLYSLVFHCKVLGGTLRAHPLECASAGWFSRDALPAPLAGADRWVEGAFAAIGGEEVAVHFDRPRHPVWRGSSAG